MSAKHTLGPWEIRDDDEDGVVSIIGSSHIVIALVRTATVDPGDENARLISAAPDLLEALREHGLTFEDESAARAEFGDKQVDREIRRRSAIAKATGEPQCLTY